MPKIQEQLDLLAKQKDEANKKIKYYTTAAVGVGAVPIPFADAPILIFGQLKMIKEIFAVYNLNTILSNEIILTLLVERIVAQGGKTLAKYLVKKVIPFLGNAVSGGIAGSITYILGKGVSEIAYQLSLDSINQGKLTKNTKEIKSLVTRCIDESFSKLRMY